MAVNSEAYKKISSQLKDKNVTLVAVSKTKPVEDILELYHLGQRDFGENYVQELVTKYEQLPKDIHWHFIGHLQSNKVKLIAPFVSLIQSVDSEKLLKEIDKQAQKNNRVIDCLLQIHIAREETKFGLDEEELATIMKATPARLYHSGGDYADDTDLEGQKPLKNICIKGLMGMASFSDDKELIRNEFRNLKSLFDQLKTKNSELQTPNYKLQTISMGMSSDYEMAIEEGSNMVRIGSLLFGKRNRQT